MMIAITTLIAVAAVTSSGADMDWRPYTNGKYGYTTCYPAKLFQARPESDAGDGRKFVAHDGASITVWAEYASALNTNFKKEATNLQNSLAGSGGEVTYNAVRPAWTVFSGKKGRNIFWVKVSQKDDRIVFIQLTHPITSLARYSSIPGSLNRCSMIGVSPF